MLAILRLPKPRFSLSPMKNLLTLSLAIIALATFTGCATPERSVTTQTTTEETISRAPAPATTSTQVIRSY